MPSWKPATKQKEASHGIVPRVLRAVTLRVRAFMEKLTSSPVVLVPSTFDYSGDPKMRLGEEAEKKVMDAIVRCGHELPGIKVICFLRPCLISSNSNITREVDYCCFITYQRRHYILIAEVKCNTDDTFKLVVTIVVTIYKVLVNVHTL